MEALNIAPADNQKILSSDKTEAEDFFSTKYPSFEKFRTGAFGVMLLTVAIISIFIGVALTSESGVVVDTDVPDVKAMDAWLANNAAETLTDDEIMMNLAAANADRVTHIRKVKLNANIVNDLFNQFNNKQITFFVLKPDATNPNVLTHIVKGNSAATFQDYKSKFSNGESSIGLFNFVSGNLQRPIVTIISPDLTPDTVSSLYFFPAQANRIPVPNVHIFYGKTIQTLFRENFLIYGRNAQINGPAVNTYIIDRNNINNEKTNPLTYLDVFNQFRNNKVGFVIFTYVDTKTVKVTIAPPTTPFNIFLDQLDINQHQLAFIKAGAKTVALASSTTNTVQQLLPMFNLPTTANGFTSKYGLGTVYTTWAASKFSVTQPWLQSSSVILK